MVLTLYKLDASPPVRAVNMVIEVLGIQDVETVIVNPLAGEQMQEEYLEMNPQHTIPSLKDDDFVIWDSHAIAVYLLNKYAENHPLYPADIKKRALIDQRLHFDSGVLFPVLRTALMPILFGGEKVLKSEDSVGILKAYELLEKFLTSEWLVGDQITLADICCVATVSTLNILLTIDENEYPNLAAWLERCSAEKFYKEGNQPGLEQLAEKVREPLEEIAETIVTKNKHILNALHT